MQILKYGDRGPAVGQLQQFLNSWPTRLARLTCDGIFGKHTQTRVLEFQRDHHLTADGLVGPATMAALRKPSPSTEDFVSLLLQTIATLSMGLPPLSRPQFDSHCRKLVGPLQPHVLIGTTSAGSSIAGFIPWQMSYLLTPQGQAFMVLIIILTVIVSLLLSSKNPRTREKGIRWQREAEQMQNTAGEKAPEVAMQEALDKTIKAARDLIESKADALERCKDNNKDPSPECEKALHEIDRLKRELFEKFRKPRNSFPLLLQGITRNTMELMAAYRDASIHCNKCGDLAD